MSNMQTHEHTIHDPRCKHADAGIVAASGSRMRKILCVCDDSYVADLRCRVLASVGYDPVGASVAEAFDLLATQRFDAMVFAPQIDERTRAALRNAAGAHVKVLHLRRGEAGNLLVGAVHSLFQPGARAGRAQRNDAR